MINTHDLLSMTLKFRTCYNPFAPNLINIYSLDNHYDVVHKITEKNKEILQQVKKYCNPIDENEALRVSIFATYYELKGCSDATIVKFISNFDSVDTFVGTFFKVMKNNNILYATI